MNCELLHILFGADRGGCERDALALIRSLPEVRHRVLVLGAPGTMCDDWIEAGAAVDIDPLGHHGNRSTVAAVRRFVEQHPPSAAMIWHGLVHLPQVIHALNPLGIPIAVHGGNPTNLMSRWVDWRYELLGYVYPPKGPLPTYICCSQYVADSFPKSRYLRRFPRVVVPNAVEMPNGQAHTVRPFDSERPFVIGMVARLNSIKDHATLLRALAIVQRQFPNTRLELAGDGDERQPLYHLASELGINSAIRFLGDVTGVYKLMEGWDLFAYATTEGEGLGNAVTEAMMFGLPCVLTDVGPMREFAGDGTAVRLVPPANPEALAAAVCELIPDVAARSALSAAGREFALSRFHPENFARSHAEVLGLSSARQVSEPLRV
ncbi:MAG: glycosyltransferase [Pirellulales bacterium]